MFMTDYEYCFKQYDKAPKTMRAALSKGEENLRRALIACLLVFCFETYLGNQASAIFHAETGITLLHQWQPKKGKSVVAGVHSPAPHLVEDELVQAFAHLDLQVAILLDLRPLQLHQVVKKDCSYALKQMPMVLTTLNEARI